MHEFYDISVSMPSNVLTYWMQSSYVLLIWLNLVYVLCSKYKPMPDGPFVN